MHGPKNKIDKKDTAVDVRSEVGIDIYTWD